MIGAFVYLTACSFKNQLRRRVRRLREPRYVIGLVVGLAYFYLAFFRGSRRRRPVDDLPTAATALGAAAAPVQFVGSLFLFVTAVIAWVWPSSRPPLPFSRAEVQFLFTAPVTRRQLVHYLLWRSQLAILFGSAIATLVLRPGSLAGGWTLLAGIWVVLMTLRLHMIGVGLRRLSMAFHGAAGLARQWLPVAVVLGAIGVLVWTVAAAWPSLRVLPDGPSAFAAVQAITAQGAARVVLWPFVALVRLPLAASAGEFLAALPAAALLLVLNYAWVLRSDAAFEEASAAYAERQASARAAPRPAAKGPGATPFTLAPEGRPEPAILWKNLILVGRYLSLRTVLRLLPLVILLAVAARGSAGRGAAVMMGAAALPFAAMAVLLGPQMLRNDLRQDLARLPLLKTWPVSGAALIRGEVLAPTVIATSMAWLALLFAFVLGAGPVAGGAWAALGESRASIFAAAFILAPAVVAAQVVAHNGLAVLFPAWAAIGATRARGIDAMGQRLLLLAGMLFTLLVSLLPGVAAAAAFAGVVYLIAGTVLVVAPAMLAALVVAAECWVAIEGLGRVLDRTDPSAVEAGE
jgi:hypothetical protein